MVRFFLLVSVLILQLNYLYGFSGLQLSNISMKDGLSNFNVSAVCQDQLGYIWVATMRGLNRYNGSEFNHYYYNPNDTNSLNSNHINALLSSENGLIYIGSSNGINVYNEKLDIFKSPFPSLKNMKVKEIYRDLSHFQTRK